MTKEDELYIHIYRVKNAIKDSANVNRLVAELREAGYTDKRIKDTFCNMLPLPL